MKGNEMQNEKPAPNVGLEHVEWRIDSQAYERQGQATCRWVPYLSAARVMILMDDWVGPGRWRIDSYEMVHWGKDGLVCTISVYFDEVGWVQKSGAGVIDSGLHGAKASESDAFRRCAGRTWGCGRNVYELPTLWAPCRFKVGRLDKKGNLQALGATRDTEHALLNELKSRGVTDAVVRISAKTEGLDEFGEGPTGQIIPDTATEPTAPVVAQTVESAPVAGVAEVVEANGSTAEGTWDEAFKALSALSGPLPKQARSELLAAGLWPIKVDESATALAATLGVLGQLAETQAHAEAA